jgi:translation initiation factor 1
VFFRRASFVIYVFVRRAMAKPSDKKKIEVPGAGEGPALKHNPFGALGGVTAPQAPATSEPAVVAAPAPPKSRGRLILRREKKQRGGKTVVVVAGLRASAHLAESEIEKLAQYLKQQLGCGGAVERVTNDTEIVIQGDQPARVAELLREKNFRVDGVTS